MNKEGGFVKLYRSMLQWEWHDDPITVATWCYCLMRANYAAVRWHGEVIKAGQFVTSLSHMAKEIGITKGQLRTALNHLKSTQSITQSSAQHATLITIEKWGEYQGGAEKFAQLSAQHATSQQHLDNISSTTIKEYKESKERKEKETREKAPESQGAFEGAWYHEPIKYTESETSELLSEAHSQFAPIKEMIMKS